MIGGRRFEEKEVDAIQKLIAAIEHEFRTLAPTA